MGKVEASDVVRRVDVMALNFRPKMYGCVRTQRTQTNVKLVCGALVRLSDRLSMDYRVSDGGDGLSVSRFHQSAEDPVPFSKDGPPALHGAPLLAASDAVQSMRAGMVPFLQGWAITDECKADIRRLDHALERLARGLLDDDLENFCLCG